MLIDQWFGLTYANYLVIPRLQLQSMPEDWQHAFTELIDKIPEVLNITEGTKYMVKMRVNGKFAHDPHSDYRRGVVERN